MTLRMLIEGHSDPVSAKRLGVSPRTYAGYVADLKEEFESETRFQLGYTLGPPGRSPAVERRAVTDEPDPAKCTKAATRWVAALMWPSRAGGWRWDRTSGG